MTREDVKTMIGDFREIENEKLLEKIIEGYEDDDASYKEVYLISQKDSEKNTDVYFAVLDYGTSFTVIDEDGNAQTYDKEDVAERYNEIDMQKFYDYFYDYFEESVCDGKFYESLNKLWKDIYHIIDEYRLDKEKFLRCFMKDNGKVDYDVVWKFYNCLKFDYAVWNFYNCLKFDSATVSDFIKEYYKSNL